MILKNLKAYGYQGLDKVIKLCHLLNGIFCDKLSKWIVVIKTNHYLHQVRVEAGTDEERGALAMRISSLKAKLVRESKKNNNND